MTDTATPAADGTTQAAAPATQTAAADVAVQTPAAQTATATTPPEPAKTTEDPAPGAPEVYEFKSPEGSALDGEGLAAFGEFAKGQNMTQEAAQGLLDALAPALAARQQARVAETVTTWAEDAKADKEYGGAKFEVSMATAEKALTQFGTPEFVGFLRESGLANHPEMIRTFLKVGQAISEDTLVVGQARPEADKSFTGRASTLYPSLK
jgi:hypothetical protein